MPELRCSVQTCVHNQQYLCALDSIEVGGREAKSPGETRCDSFQERSGDACTNVVDDASSMTNIDCQAKGCEYNENCVCRAGKISVEGSHACHADGTQCATFVC